jgi:hypothetical protein
MLAAIAATWLVLCALTIAAIVARKPQGWDTYLVGALLVIATAVAVGIFVMTRY